jgi:hypothetical protein
VGSRTAITAHPLMTKVYQLIFWMGSNEISQIL